MLKALAAKVDVLIVGGGIANTFILAAHGHVGKSLVEADLVPEAQAILDALPGKVPIPVDVVCAKEFSPTATPTLKAIENVEPDDMILDIGPSSIAVLKMIVAKAGTIVWNGPVGVFEFDAFAAGTRALAEAIAASQRVLDRRRRRHDRRDQQVRRRRPHLLHLDRRRRVPRVPRGQDAAGRRHARAARKRLTDPRPHHGDPMAPTRVLLIAGCLLALLLGGCGKSSNDSANVRVLNLISGATGVTVTAGGTTLMTGGAFEAIGGYTSVGAGNQEFKVTVPGSTGSLVDTIYSLGSSVDYTYVTTGTPGAAAAVLVADPYGSPGGNNFAVRVLNMSATDPSIDLYLTAPGADLATATPVVTAAAFATGVELRQHARRRSAGAAHDRRNQGRALRRDAAGVRGGHRPDDRRLRPRQQQAS